MLSFNFGSLLCLHMQINLYWKSAFKADYCEGTSYKQLLQRVLHLGLLKTALILVLTLLWPFLSLFLWLALSGFQLLYHFALGRVGSRSTCDLCLNKRFQLLVYLGPCAFTADSTVLVIRVLNSGLFQDLNIVLQVLSYWN